MSAIQSKAHISIDGYLFMLARQIRTERHIYGREEAPNFVNKFSSGDPNYRDSTFFPHFVQNNWLNGFDQEKFNDGGKYFRSESIDPTTQEEVTLQKLFSSAGLTAAGVKVLCQKAWRAAAQSSFGDGSDGALTISTDTTDSPIDSACTGTSGSTSLTATNASFAANQIILIHQSQGTGAGTWQKNKIQSYVAGTITLVDPLNATYTTGAQVIVMKQYSSITIDSTKTLSCKPWNGTTGGILAFMCSGQVTVTGTMSVKGATGIAQTGGNNSTGGGFRGGGGCVDPVTTAIQGEGETGVGSQSKSANGMGGGAAQTTSLGGVAYQTDADLSTRFTFGGGGGGGKADRGTGPAGGNGGGIIFAIIKTLTVTGAITADGGTGRANGSNDWGDGGGGGGGGIYLKVSTATMGTGLIHASGGLAGTGGNGGKGAGGAGSVNGNNGDAAAPAGDGGAGRVHIDYAVSYSGTTTPTLDAAQDSTLVDSAASGTFTHLVGCSDGKIYSWDGATTFTEVMDCRKLAWYEDTTLVDSDKIVGDTGGTETAQGQSFQVAAATKMKAVRVYIKKNAGTPGDITVRIETNSTDKPSGTLVSSDATATISAFTTTSYGWVTVEFPATFSLSASTTYWIVLKTAAASNDNNYAWGADASSPTYSSGTMAASTDGGSTWSAVSAADAMFRVLGASTTVNCGLITDVGGTQKVYWGTGDPEGTNNGDARLYSYDGTTWALAKTFNTTNEAAILSMAEFGATTATIYFGLGYKAKVYKTTDFSTYTLSKTITVPGNPGYVFSLCEYNGRLYAGGGHPEQLNNTNNQFFGFLYSYDEYQWVRVGDFDHTVIKSLETYDNLLFIGTIKSRFYVYNTASVDKLLEFPWDVQITDMKKWEDKLAIALATTPGSTSEGFEGIYIFDRNGFHNAFSISGKEWYSIGVHNNNLMCGSDDGYVYKTTEGSYHASGTIQTSYCEASLPSIDKKWRSLILQYTSLPTGCSIVAHYKTDESDASWTSLGTADTVASTSAEFTFPVAFYSKKITIRLTLATSVPANTPTLKLIDLKYVLYPDFKYMWKMTLACPDNLEWLDRSRPITHTTASNSAGATSLTVADTSGLPTQGRGVLVDDGVEDEFTWTGKTSTTLTGIPATGSLALGAHTYASPGMKVKMTGATLHHTILALKQAKSLYTFVDIDGTSYTVLFHGYQEDNFVVDQTGGLENHVPITLLEV